MSEPIEWTEPGIPQQYALLVANVSSGEHRPATVDDLRLGCSVAGLPLCSEERDCDEHCTRTDQNGVTCDIALRSHKDIHAQAVTQLARSVRHVSELEAIHEVDEEHLGNLADRITHLEAALEQSEAARADMADKLDDAQACAAWGKRCIEFVQRSMGDDDVEMFMLEARNLAAKMTSPPATDVIRRDFEEHRSGD